MRQVGGGGRRGCLLIQEDLPQVPISALVVVAGGWGGLVRLHAGC